MAAEFMEAGSDAISMSNFKDHSPEKGYHLSPYDLKCQATMSYSSFDNGHCWTGRMQIHAR